MDLRLTFGVSPTDSDGMGAPPAPAEVEGLTRVDLAELSRGLDTAVRLSTEPGSMGKGASGPGIDPVLHLTEQVLTDGAAAFAWGSVLWTLIRRIRPQRRLGVQDPLTVGALAAAAQPMNESRLRGAHLTGTVCLTGGGVGMGTDARDVWATSFVLDNEMVLVLFTSPSGLVLGEVTVVPEWTSRLGQLDSATVADAFASSNGRNAGPTHGPVTRKQLTQQAVSEVISSASVSVPFRTDLCDSRVHRLWEIVAAWRLSGGRLSCLVERRQGRCRCPSAPGTSSGGRCGHPARVHRAT